MKTLNERTSCLQMRVTQHRRDLLERAATLTGRSLTQFVLDSAEGLDHRFGQSASKMLRFRLDSRFRGNDKRLQSQRFFRHSRESGNPE
ncbi:MAG: DUF1778 domain-containing protein [Magnetococcales bacterium]|nr:DUF1778 domain-containing protein [Magnetococcales bacterium]